MSTDPRRRLGRALGAAGTAALVLGLAACGGGDSDDGPDDEPTLDLGGSSSATTAPTDGPASSDPTTGEGDVPAVRPAPEQGDRLEDRYAVWALELPEKKTAKIVGQALVTYMDVRLGAYFAGEADLADAARVAVGQPLTEIQGYAVELRQQKLHTVGDLWLSIDDSNVKVTGKSAKVSDACAHNATANVNAGGVAQESPTDAYLLDATVVKAAADIWLISDLAFTAVDDC
ncbi:hypothetical protein [Nocardioides sp.]|uniref:hypothetical protein n=1 Tax=Nocardioides sp. TaxID=35761 RepID=UPI0027201952|nr:hypothetical protein [Nocardioides sp.]MDO9458481.1 hypothetical protein [Nocardioides sp.]